MKVAIDARGAVWFRGTGIGTYVYQLVANLIEIDKVTPYILFWPSGAPVDFRLSPNFQVMEVSEHGDRTREEEYIASVLKAESVDVYHVPQNGLGVPKDVKAKLVVTIHDLIPYVLPQTCTLRYLQRFFTYVPRALEMAAQVITVSAQSRSDLIKILGVPEEKIVVIHEAPEPFYMPEDKAKAAEIVSKRYGVTSPYILYIGGFSLRKNLMGLLYAYSQIRDRLSMPRKLVIAGKPTGTYDRLKSLTTEFGLEEDVQFPGFIPVEDLVYLYSAADLFVYPSFYEGFGLPPLEAMACRVPVVTTTVSSMPEVVGDAAYLVDPYDPAAIAKAMLEVLEDSDLANRLAAKGFERAKSFSWRKTARHTLMVYEALTL